MPNDPLGFAVIGLGSIAHFHIRCIQELEGCRLVAVASSTPERVEEAEERYGVAGYSNIDAMLLRKDIDVVCICTASGYHLEPTLAAARAGKHIICEKPLEVNLERADHMIQACREAGVKLACIFQSRFKEDYLRIRSAIRAGKLGKVVLANAYIKWYRDDEYYASRSWRGTLKGDGGAALINQSIHTIDLLQDLMGPVKSIYGKVRTMTHDIEGEDLGLAILQFENGAMGTIEGSTSVYPGYPERLEIHGSKGSIVYEGGKIIAWNLLDAPVEKIGGAAVASGASDPMAIDYGYHKKQIQDMVHAIHEDREPQVNGEEGRKVLEIISAIYESSKKGEEVVLSKKSD